MRHVVLPVVIVILAASFAGCAKPCFYQAGKSIEQCKHDLRQCIDQAHGQRKSQSDELTRSCMQAKGYECLDADKVPQNAKRIVVIAPFETYVVLDGLGPSTSPSGLGRPDREMVSLSNHAVPARSTAAAEEKSQEKPPERAPEAPVGKTIGYRARLDEKGRYVITPVYEHDLKKEADSSRSANSGK